VMGSERLDVQVEHLQRLAVARRPSVHDVHAGAWYGRS
jgi:hypothetical protein